MKRNTRFGAAGLLVAGAAIGAGAIVSQNAMADDGASLTADTVTMINVDAEGNAVQCTFTGADAEGLVFSAVPTDDAIKAQVITGSAQVVEIDGTLPEIQVDDGLLVGSPIPVGDVPLAGVITVSATGGFTGEADGQFVVSDVAPAEGFLSAGEAREGTADECAAMHDQTLADMAAIGAHGGGGAVISVSGGVGVTTEP